MEQQLEMGRHERLLRRQSAPGSVLSAFATDGCSGGLSAAWAYLASRLPGLRARHGDRPPWESCCVAHDRLYHAAAPLAPTPTGGFAARRAADLALQACVLETGAARVPQLGAEYGWSDAQVMGLYGAVARLMYRAVRMGGVPCSGLSWRWGYGWPECD